MNAQTIVLATLNDGKLREFRQKLEPRIRIVSQREFEIPAIEETGTTFVENALLKARHAARHAGLPSLADDSGLVVDHLQGGPGIYSSRYAGPNASDAENCDKLLAALEGVADNGRQAHFYCVLVFLRWEADPVPLICTGAWHGTILHSPRGEGGFGYDPVFFDPIAGCAAAEMAMADKNRVSHRSEALRALVAALAARSRA